MLRILLVDPDPSVSAVLSEALNQEMGATVTCAASGAVASRALRGMAWDLAVIEAMLPDMTGFKLAEIAAINNVPGLLIAGHPRSQETCCALGYPHLNKPFSLFALHAAATAVLRDGPRNVEWLQEAYERLSASSFQARCIMEATLRTWGQSRRNGWNGCESPRVGGAITERAPAGAHDDRPSVPVEVLTGFGSVFRSKSLAFRGHLDAELRRTIRQWGWNRP